MRTGLPQPAPSASASRLRRRPRAGLIALVLVTAAGGLGWSSVRPSNDRPWVPEQARLASARIDGPTLILDNVRNFDWSGDTAVEAWERRSYDLDRIASVWYVLTPFARDWRGPAHAFLSFGFDDGAFLAISVEARKEIGERYEIWKGLLKRFELTYAVGDERDFIGLRVLRHQTDAYVYPVRATREAARALLLDMLDAVNELAGAPAFYGSLRDNCTTRILDHVNRIAPERIPYGWRVLLPGYSDALVLERGLLDTDLPLDAARARFLVNERVRAHIGAPDFSSRIRE